VHLSSSLDVTFRAPSTCGVIIHETYNQLLPKAEEELAEHARQKTSLGYHDIRTGNEPDDRLLTFITENMMSVASDARSKFDDHKDLLDAFSSKQMDYIEFAALMKSPDGL
jgi:hypothetical protein